jgi:environmental stress-induced protein Ves
MPNSIQIHDLGECKVTRWSGGTTTELCILPDESSFEDRVFDLRISIATVEVEQTVYTSMPGFKRTLLLMEGRLELKIPNDPKLLNKGDVVTFSGSPGIECLGKGVNFNLIYSNKFKCSKLELIRPNTSCTIDLAEHDVFILYCRSGNVTVCIDQEIIQISKDQFIIIDQKKKIEWTAISESLIVWGFLSRK